MKLALAVLVYLVCVNSGQAFSNVHAATFDSYTVTADDGTVIDINETLFDFPITKAIGLSVNEILRPEPRGPSINDLSIPLNR